MCLYRGYSNHADPETDSDGDGGARPKLRGKGHIEFSKKGIPHGILHFVRQLQLAGHIFMHDTTASEAAHRLFVKKVMNRVRKGTDYDTSYQFLHRLGVQSTHVSKSNRQHSRTKISKKTT